MFCFFSEAVISSFLLNTENVDLLHGKQLQYYLKTEIYISFVLSTVLRKSADRQQHVNEN